MEAWEMIDNPASSGFDQIEYDVLESAVQKQMENLSIKIDNFDAPIKIKETTANQMQNTLPLPKVTIPQFCGDYLKWRQFELFSQMIDKQHIPAVQKMWYMKSNVSGEAAKLISHFSLTDELQLGLDSVTRQIQQQTSLSSSTNGEIN